MRESFLYLILLLLVYSCSLNNSDSSHIIKIDYNENLRVYISDNYKKIKPGKELQQITLSNTNLINKFYTEIKHSPIWIDDSLDVNKNGYKLIELLSTSYNYGLDTASYYGHDLTLIAKNLKAIKEKKNKYELASELELLLSNSYFLIGKHLNYGIVPKDSAKLVSDIPRKEFKIDLSKSLLNSFKTDSIITVLLNLQPQHKEYIRLQEQFAYYLKTASLSKKKIKVEHFRKDSIMAFEQSRKALILHHYLKQSNSDSDYILALEKFQLQHGLKPDGLVGKNTAKALSKSPYSDYIKGIVSLEKWRWRNHWSNNYIFVNIPSYRMKIYQNNDVIKSLNVVVGKPATHTPELNDSMEHLMVFPYWNLPYSISSKEILPKIKKDSTYLKRNGYKVFTNKYKSVNTNSINWNTVTESNFNYKIRQEGGRTNSLGLIKFIFPNKHSIYFHDTPSKHYFKYEIRAYSHGCVRVQQPFQLAETILTFDENEYNVDSVKVFIKKRKQKQMNLNNKIPVYIQYFTCGTDSSNNLVFYKDIYGWDEKMAELMGLNGETYSANEPALVSK